MPPAPEVVMAPVMIAWTAWLIVLALRRGRTASALACVAAIFAANGLSILVDAVTDGPVGTDAASLVGRWAAVAVTAALLLVTIRATWRPQSAASRNLAPPDDNEVDRRIREEVDRRVRDQERQNWMRTRSSTLAEVVLMECDEEEARYTNGHAVD